VPIQGCYRDNPGSRDLPVQMTGFDQSLTPALCVAACRDAGYSYAGLQVVTHLNSLSNAASASNSKYT